MDESECDTSRSPQPAVSAGKLFIAVHPGGWKAGRPLDYAYEEIVGVNVTVNYRGTEFQLDRWEKVAGIVDEGVEFVSRKVIAAVYTDPIALVNRANTILNLAGQASQFIPGIFLRFQKAEPCVERKAEWWGARANKEDGPIGMSQTLIFDGAVRAENLTSLQYEPDNNQ